MATLDYILGNPGGSINRRNVGVAPAPIDEALRGAPASAGSTPSLRSGHDDGEPSLRSGHDEAVKAAGDTGMMTPTDKIPSSSRRMSYVDLFKALNPDKPETAEERARREKREKSEAILSAVGDGISALTNLFFTTRYAPNAYDASQGMSAKAKERWDRLRQEREANRRAYTDGYLRALAMDEAGDREDRNWRHTLERERISDERYEAQAERDKARAELDEQLRRREITAAEYKAEQERIAALFAPDYEKSRVNRNNAAAAASQASAVASRASAAASTARANAENRRELKEFSAWDENGKEWKFKDEDAAIAFARQHGTYEEGNTTTSETVTEITPGRKDNKGNQLTPDETKTRTKNTTKPGNGYARRPSANKEQKTTTEKNNMTEGKEGAQKKSGKWSNTSKIEW